MVFIRMNNSYIFFYQTVCQEKNTKMLKIIHNMTNVCQHVMLTYWPFKFYEKSVKDRSDLVSYYYSVYLTCYFNTQLIFVCIRLIPVNM